MNEEPKSRPEVLMVAHAAAGHVGAHWRRAVQQLGLRWQWKEASEAYFGPRLIRRVLWHALDRIPARLWSFERELLELCQQQRPRLVLVSGITPPRAALLARLRALGIKTANFLTDHPLNPAHRSRWFLRALRQYDFVFSPRRATLQQLADLGCRQVDWLPFAYDPQTHGPPSPQECADPSLGLPGKAVFIGGADADRVAWLGGLMRGSESLSVWGGYWDRWPGFAAAARGHATPEQMRALVAQAGVNIGLVRLANEDDHSMRSYELPAIGGLLLMQDTLEHRRMFAACPQDVLFAATAQELEQRVHEALQLPASRRVAMASAARRCIVGGGNSYRDRLMQILQQSQAL